jgi:hypothetical protein
VTSSIIILLQWPQATAWNCLFCVSLPSWNMKFWYCHDRNLIEWGSPIWGLQMLVLKLCKSTTGNVATWSPWIKRFPCSPSTFHFKIQKFLASLSSHGNVQTWSNSSLISFLDLCSICRTTKGHHPLCYHQMWWTDRQFSLTAQGRKLAMGWHSFVPT